MAGDVPVQSQIPLVGTCGCPTPQKDSLVLVANAPGAWGELVMEQHRSRATELSGFSYRQHVVVVNVGSPVVCEYKKSGRWHSAKKGQGAVSLFPSHSVFSRRMRTTVDAIYLALDPLLFSRETDEILPLDAEFAEARREKDPFLYSLAQTLRQAARTSLRKDLLFGSSMAMSLARYLARDYAPTKITLCADRHARLDPRSLGRVREFIEANLDRSMRVHDIAKVAGLSPAHFNRLFRKTTGRSPYRYVADLRLQRAKEMLLGGASSIKDVTYSLGFSDQSHLTREVKRVYGLTPREILLQTAR